MTTDNRVAMDLFHSKSALIEARATARLRDNLNLLSKITTTIPRHVNQLNDERDAAMDEVVYVDTAKVPVQGIPSGISAWYIKGFGYARA